MTVANRSAADVAEQPSAPLASGSPAPDSSDREIVATRLFDAPRALVFKVWTDPAHIARWWGPTGFTTTTSAMDVRPAGVWRYCMHGPDGVDYQNKITYLEVMEPERIVYQHAGDQDREPVEFQVTVTFEEHDGKTKLTMRMVFPSAAKRALVVEKYGAVEGLHQTLDRLGKYAVELAEAGRSGLTATLPTHREVALTRTFDAPRSLVFEAWTDPKHLARWWGPHCFTNPVCEVDVRPGGAIRIDMAGPDGTVYPMKGVFHDVVAPERLVFTSSALEDEQGHPRLEVHNTITFAEHDGKTTLTVKAVVVRATPEAAAALSGMEAGWTQSLERLQAELAKA
jgi:uncharacterized protein YndB with AHSA1/START domain